MRNSPPDSAERVPHFWLDTGGTSAGAAERRHRLAHGEPVVGCGRPTRVVSPGRGDIREFFGQNPTAGRRREPANGAGCRPYGAYLSCRSRSVPRLARRGLNDRARFAGLAPRQVLRSMPMGRWPRLSWFAPLGLKMCVPYPPCPAEDMGKDQLNQEGSCWNAELPASDEWRASAGVVLKQGGAEAGWC